jgi:hypothetical protein
MAGNGGKKWEDEWMIVQRREPDSVSNFFELKCGADGRGLTDGNQTTQIFLEEKALYWFNKAEIRFLEFRTEVGDAEP